MSWVALLAAVSDTSPAMTKMGRPTQDPKGERITVRVAPRDVAALQQLANRDGVTLAEAARRLVREALGVPTLPKKKTLKKHGRKM